MAYKLSEAWQDGYGGPFVRRDGSQTTLTERVVRDGFVMYRNTEGVLYHASGRPEGATTDELDIDGRYTPPTAKAKKTKPKKKPAPRKLDTRLGHLLKLQKEARRDVERYVTNKWVPGKNISYEHQGKHCTGKVMYHDTDDSVVCVYEEENKRKVRIPYARIKDRRASMK